jgi:AcrR family transcriptional regulator
MSTVPSAGVQTKRKRGYLRVAAIMQAGIDVFTEKGYDAATMTEIATRSGTATASLYRFFPSKESLADALLLQYAKYALGGLAELRGRAANMTLDDIAGALVDLRLELRSQRRFAIDLADARGGSDDKRRQFRKAMLDGLTSVLREVNPALTKARCEVMAAVVLHVLKGVTAIDQEKPTARRMLLAEIKELIRVYLASAQLSEKD